MTQDQSTVVEITDLLLVTTLMTTVIAKMRQQGTAELAAKRGDMVEQETITQIVPYWSENCATTLDAGARDLINSLTYIATVFGIYWRRSRRRSYNSGGVGPLGPTIRIKYDH